VAEHVGLWREEIHLMVARAIGFKAASAKLKDVIEKAVVHTIDENKIVLRDEKLFPS
jgi:hypothetical protein